MRAFYMDEVVVMAVVMYCCCHGHGPKGSDGAPPYEAKNDSFDVHAGTCVPKLGVDIHPHTLFDGCVSAVPVGASQTKSGQTTVRLCRLCLAGGQTGVPCAIVKSTGRIFKVEGQQTRRVSYACRPLVQLISFPSAGQVRASCVSTRGCDKA